MNDRLGELCRLTKIAQDGYAYSDLTAPGEDVEPLGDAWINDLILLACDESQPDDAEPVDRWEEQAEQLGLLGERPEAWDDYDEDVDEDR